MESFRIPTSAPASVLASRGYGSGSFPGRLNGLTTAFSKKVENLAHAVSLPFMYYNFPRIHKTLRVTPVMEAGISDHVWTLEEIVALCE